MALHLIIHSTEYVRKIHYCTGELRVWTAPEPLGEFAMCFDCYAKQAANNQLVGRYFAPLLTAPLPPWSELPLLGDRIPDNA